MDNREKLLKIYIDCFVKVKQKGDIEAMVSTDFFFEEVMKAGLAKTAKEWFLLGALAQQVHDFGPEGMKKTMDMLAGNKQL